MSTETLRLIRDGGKNGIGHERERVQDHLPVYTAPDLCRPSSIRVLYVHRNRTACQRRGGGGGKNGIGHERERESSTTSPFTQLLMYDVHLLSGCFTSTETVRLVRDGWGGGRGGEGRMGGGNEREPRSTLLFTAHELCTVFYQGALRPQKPYGLSETGGVGGWGGGGREWHGE